MKGLKSSNDRDWRMLEWYLRFLNTPVSDLRTRGELLDFYDYFSTFAFGKLFHVASQQDERPDSMRIEQYRKCCRIIFIVIWNKRKSGPSFIDISKIYRYSALAQILKAKETVQTVSVSFSVLVDSDGKSITARKIPSVNWNAEFDIHFVNVLISATIDFLRSYDLLQFHKCAKKECQKFFYQRTKRQKNYCSLRCAGTVRQRRFQEDKKKQNNPSHKKARKSELVECPGNPDNPLGLKVTSTECINPDGKNIRGKWYACPTCPHYKKGGTNNDMAKG